jgi:hypothetical protein
MTESSGRVKLRHAALRAETQRPCLAAIAYNHARHPRPDPLVASSLLALLDDIATVLDEAFRILRDDRLRVTYLAHLID